MKKTIKMRLIIDVEYKPNGVDVEELKNILLSIPKNICNDGGFTWITEAEVESWTSKVKILDYI